MIDIKHLIDSSEHEVCSDEAAIRDKAKVMREQHKTSTFFGIAETFQFISAVMLPVAMGVLVAEVKAAGVAVSLGTIASVLTAPTVGLFFGAAVACTVIAIGARYIASHHLHNATYNSSELNAQHTAKYLAQEIQKSQAPQHEQNCRADGKQWAQVVLERPASQQMARN